MKTVRYTAIAMCAGVVLLAGFLWLWRGSVFPLTSAPVKVDPYESTRASAALFPDPSEDFSAQTAAGPLVSPKGTPTPASSANIPPAALEKKHNVASTDFTLPGTGRDAIDRGKPKVADGTADAPSAKQLPTVVETRVRTTAYTHTESDHIKYGTLTALGTHLRYSPEYHSVAADWSRFPLGTKFRMKGQDRLFVVDDYGKALVGGATVDIYFPTKERMNNWGVRWVDIEVVEFGNFHESRKILAARATYPHCREMLATMTNDNWWKDFR